MTDHDRVADITVDTYGMHATIPVSRELWEDMKIIQESQARAMEAAHKRWIWARLGSRDPWGPGKGFDFRENPGNRYPEPDYCECCGRSDDD